MEFGSILTAVQTGKADIGVAGMTITEDRLLNVNSPSPIPSHIRLLLFRKTPLLRMRTIWPIKPIGVQESTTGDIYVTDEYPDAKIERYSKGVEAVQALLQGKWMP
jgi:ABC-type amino acid transport substrate-binding protein